MPLPRPFFVMATQNPIEQEGTYPLPEAQTDRFLFKLIVDYPKAEEEAAMMQRWGQVTQQPTLAAVSSGEELLELRAGGRPGPCRPGRAELHPGDRAGDAGPRRAVRPASATSISAPRRGPRSRSTRRAGPSRGCAARTTSGPRSSRNSPQTSMRHRLGLTYEAEAEELTADQPDRPGPRSKPRCRPFESASHSQSSALLAACGSSSGGCATPSRTR